METLLFYLFAALTLICALLVVANPFTRNPVTSAMFLVLAIVSMAGLFVLLHAFFLAAVQILVYAGAVMVLFLFVIMLLNVKEEERKPFRKVFFVLGLVVAVAVAAAILKAGQAPLALGANPPREGDTRALGRLLFEGYLLPFEIVSVILLAAMIGVVVLSKKNLNK
jgi:NADH-quinone oxidoreductase subunit J